MSDDSDGDILTLVSNRPPVKSEPATRQDEAVAPGQAYATAKGQRVATSLEFIWKSGKSFVMPYAYLPISWWHPPDTILIEYPGVFTVGMEGKNLEELHYRIGDQRVTWVQEFDAVMAAYLPLAVTRIDILRAYPSREASGTPW